MNIAIMFARLIWQFAIRSDKKSLGKAVDIGEYNYTQNLGPVWKLLCLMSMGVSVPAAAAQGIIEEQQQWVKSRQQRSSKEYIHAR